MRGTAVGRHLGGAVATATGPQGDFCSKEAAAGPAGHHPHAALRPRGWRRRAPSELGDTGDTWPLPPAPGTGTADRTAPRGVKDTGETRLGEGGGAA